MNGNEMLINQVLKMLKIDPDQFKQMAGGIGQTVIGFKAQLDRIEAKQDAIMSHLGMTEPGTMISLQPETTEHKNG